MVLLDNLERVKFTRHTEDFVFPCDLQYILHHHSNYEMRKLLKPLKSEYVTIDNRVAMYRLDDIKKIINR